MKAGFNKKTASVQCARVLRKEGKRCLEKARSDWAVEGIAVPLWRN